MSFHAEMGATARLGQTMVIPVLAHQGSTDLIASSPQTSTSAVKIIPVKMELLVCPACRDTHVLAPLASREGTVKMLLTIVKRDRARMMAYVSHSLMTTNVFAKMDSLAGIARRTMTTARTLHVQMVAPVLTELMISNALVVQDSQAKTARRKLTSVIPILVSTVVSARTETTLSPASAFLDIPAKFVRSYQQEKLTQTIMPSTIHRCKMMVQVAMLCWLARLVPLCQ